MVDTRDNPNNYYIIAIHDCLSTNSYDYTSSHHAAKSMVFLI